MTSFRAEGDSSEAVASTPRARLRSDTAARTAVASPKTRWLVGLPRRSVAFVHAGEVVQDERGRVRHLDRAGGDHRRVLRRPESRRPDEGEEGADSFAGGQQGVSDGPVKFLGGKLLRRDELAELLVYPLAQAVLDRLEVVAHPDAADAGRGDRDPALLELVGHSDLAPGGLRGGHLQHRVLDFPRNPVPQDRLLARDLLERFLAACLVQLLEPVKLSRL